MFLRPYHLCLLALLQFGGIQGGAGGATALNNSSLSLILGDQCVTRDEVQAVIRLEVQSVVRKEVRSIVQQEIQSLVSYLVEVQQNNTAHLLQAITAGSLQSPAVRSCKNIPQGSPSGSYWIQNNLGVASQQYCDMTRTCCGSTGGWMRVANLDMTDQHQSCPSGFKLITSPRRTCGRPGPVGCVSTTFPVHGVQYSRVCGRVIGYQFSSPSAFYPYSNGGQQNIDGHYVDGVSLTYGNSPRQHIWTFAAAINEVNFAGSIWVCPCTDPYAAFTGSVPPFIGQDYFCETGSRRSYQSGRFYSEDPLWNGLGCGPRSTCCGFNNPPWFCKQLSQSTTDDIELRLCSDEPISDEDTPLEIVEIYIQ